MATRARKAILVDVDGTLIDSNDGHTRAWVEVLRRHGHTVPYDRIRPLIGKGGDKLLDEAVGIDDESDEGKQIASERRELFAAEYLPTLEPTPGARALLERLRAEGILVVVATSAGSDELKDLLRRAGVEDLIPIATSTDDAEASKPDPDIVEAALRKAGVQASEAVMLGDTPYDATAATAAGVATIAVRCGGWWDDAALGDAVRIYDDPGDLLAGLKESPLFVAGER